MKTISIDKTKQLSDLVLRGKYSIEEYVLRDDVTIVVAFSGGKDSIAMVFKLLGLGVPKRRIELWHHDVDGHRETVFDWACTSSYCEAFAKAMGLKLLFSYREGGITREMYRENQLTGDVLYQNEMRGDYVRLESTDQERYYNTRRKFPAVSANLQTRWCSSAVKIDVGRRVLANMERMKEAAIVFCTGERRAESTARSKYNEIESHPGNGKKRKVIQWRPVIEWSDEKVWSTMEKNRIQSHPAYELGWGRCSCQTCIFNGPAIWAMINKISPERVKKIGDMEEDFGFTLYDKMTIYEKVIKGGDVELGAKIKRWAKEATGKFTSPLIVDKWVRPKGANNNESCGSI